MRQCFVLYPFDKCCAEHFKERIVDTYHPTYMNQYRQYLQHLSAHSPTTAFLCKSLLGLKLLDEFYLGLDLTNEALTCTIINDHYTPVYRKVVVFDKDLPAKYTERYSDTPAITWIAALDKLFTDITESFEFDLGRVSAIGGSTDVCTLHQYLYRVICD